MVGSIKFMPNRVWRVYLGGSGIDALRHAEHCEDNHFPEDWIASDSLANNPQYPAENQGLSRLEIDGKEMFFRDFLETYAEDALGSAHIAKFGKKSALLMKILDSAERLPIQAHPSVPDAQKYFNSNFGKTESWYIIGAREVNGEAPYLLMGFNDKLNKDVFINEALHGDFPTGKEMLHKINVKPGDCFMIPGGLPHAIGCGVTVIETMEPSDLVIQPEFFCGTQRLSDAERWSGADPEDAMRCFAYTPESEEDLRKRCTPEAAEIEPGLTRVIPYELARYFEVQRLECDGEFRFTNREKRHRAGVVVDGSVTLTDSYGTLELQRGDTFFMPCCQNEALFKGKGTVIFSLPPQL